MERIKQNVQLGMSVSLTKSSASDRVVRYLDFLGLGFVIKVHS